MSGVTIRVQIQPGAATAAALRARRERFLAERRVRVEQAVAARTAGGRVVAVRAGGLDAIVELAARREAARAAPAHTARAADVAIARAVSSPTREAREVARSAVEALERAEEQTVLAQERQELTLAELLSNLPPGIEARPELTRTADGTLRAHVALAGAGQMGIELDAGGGDVRLDMSRAAVDEVATADGVRVGCDAERAVGELVFARWRKAGIDVATLAVGVELALAMSVARKAGVAR